MTMTMTEPTPPVSGWAWVLQGLGALPRQRTQHQRGWDGLFRAACGCGRDVDWDAFRLQPICSCPVLFRELLEPDPWS